MSKDIGYTFAIATRNPVQTFVFCKWLSDLNQAILYAKEQIKDRQHYDVEYILIREGTTDHNDPIVWDSRHKPEPVKYTWQRRNGYEVSTKGDERFSAMTAKMPDGRTIEMWYQCDIKGYCIGGTNWKLGKGKPPLIAFSKEQMWDMYLNLWRLWAIHNHSQMAWLAEAAKEKNCVLSDCFASTDVNQARALATILNEWFV